ncbi:MAG: hypothetical protein HDR88_08900 [Bacteroides sp.]|nr:hypothetical protein [Bacteroides sp.]
MSPLNNISSNFMLTVKKEIIENRKALLFGIGSCWGLCILLGAFLGKFRMGGGMQEVFVFCFLFSIMSSIAGSLTFSNMKSKTGRISTLLLPASVVDKFLVRWLAVVPGLFVIMIIGFYIGDFSRIIMNWICGGNMDEHYNKIINIWVLPSKIGGSESTLVSTLFISGYFFTQALYIFGAILWPKLSFIKTMFALWALQMIVGIVSMTLNHLFDFHLPFYMSIDRFL